MDKKNATQITFGGMVFMYGNVQMVADKADEKVILTKLAGPDGLAEEIEKKDAEVEIFDKLVDAIGNIGCSMIGSEEENTFMATEEEEDTGACEWYVSVCDEEENILFCLRGTNPKSNIFKKVCETLEGICIDFGCVKTFFDEIGE